MHGAPSVSYPVGRSFWGGVLMLSAGLAGVAATGAWWLAAPGWRPAAGLALATGLGLWALASWRGSPSGELSWSGTGWTWEGRREPVSVRPEVALDLQRVLLLRLSSDGAGVRPPRWLWLQRDAQPAHWDALRRAVYSRATPDTPPAPASPAATP